jgi:FAD/FMN-containing dehydrogenase
MLADEIKKIVRGEVNPDEETLDAYSRDASLLEVRPKVVVFPEDTGDVKALVRYINEHKEKAPDLSLTARAAGTDMTGGPINDSIIVDFTTHFTREDVDEDGLRAVVEPGVYYRDFEKVTLPEHISFPVYPASKSLAAFGGMVMNNCAGSRTLRYGQMRDFVESITMVLSDGNEYTFRKLNRTELEAKKKQKDFEGELYRKVFDLMDSNYDVIKRAKPNVSKNSAGYALWEVWDRETGEFDMTHLFVGSQGTLGILTEATLRLVKDKMNKRLIVLFFKNWDSLPDVVNTLLPYDPEALEAFDDATLKLGLRFMPEIAQKVNTSFLRFALRFLPEVWIGVTMGGLPKLIMLVQLAEDDIATLDEKTMRIRESLKAFDVKLRVTSGEEDAEKYWVMRRESFSLLRKHVKGKHTAPFVDDFCIDPGKVPEFLPQMLGILKEHGIKANIAGHAGNGNFHIIPLMDFKLESERKKIPVVADKVYDLIIKYGGTITAEHNDGLIRSPYLERMYGAEVYGLFEQVKQIFDPKNIFNPRKKVGATVEYAMAHMKKT